MNSNGTLCVGVSFPSINHFECLISRIFGSIIIFISCFSILFSIRFLHWSSYHRQTRSDHNFVILSMIFSSVMLIITIVPSVGLQCLTCRRLCSSFYCQLEGFISYLNGCVHMFMLMMISIIRYDTVLHINTTKQYFKQHPYLTVITCWLFALIFALPPLFHWNKYIPEGVGFHCGLNWIDQSVSSRLYLVLAFLFVYIIPLLVLSILNSHVYCVIRRLLHGASTITQPSCLALAPAAKTLLAEKRPLPPITSIFGDRNTTDFAQFKTTKLSVSTPIHNRCEIDPISTYRTMRLKRLKADRRFALATIFLVSEYLLSWTPYACMALFYLFHMQFIIEQPLLITICAFIAKISMIINPFIYIATIKTNQLKAILFLEQCSCQKCKFNQYMIPV